MNIFEYHFFRCVTKSVASGSMLQLRKSAYISGCHSVCFKMLASKYDINMTELFVFAAVGINDSGSGLGATVLINGNGVSGASSFREGGRQRGWAQVTGDSGRNVGGAGRIPR